ncbi:MAG: hypothetical protein F4X66_03655 [Chloroflexi bacterium]|nr:hypothetical protein [Chloroflexota bacterium]MYE39512.1 hypothetical protein [Chloroflexota bacterium]
MGTAIRGCVTLLVILFVLVAILIAVLVQCGPDGGGSSHPHTPSPTPTPPPFVDAMQVWLDYQANETRANSQYKDRWFTVELGWIDRIDDGGKVLMNADASGWNQIQFDFKNDRDVIRLNPGDSVTAVCKVSGLTWDSLLVFKDCRMARTR